MSNALASPHTFEIAFDALAAAVGGLVLLLALRVAPGLTLSSHRLALRISIVAAVLIIAAQLAEVLADFSRLSTIEDAAADVAELIAVCFVGLALHQIGRAEKGEISSLRRAADVVARYGGEEFVVLMGGNIEDAIEVAERVRHGVEHESATENESLLGSSVTVSVGVAALTEDVSGLEQLVEKADDELYRAKRAGKNRVAATGRR